MKVSSRLIKVSSLALFLVGCGGGGADVTVVTAAPQFITWIGNANSIYVIDGFNHTFAFYSDTGCLYNLQTGRENPAFCLIPATNIVAYGPFRGQVENVIAADGTCRSAIIDQLTGNFADIESDAFGREVVATTSLRPAFCRR